MSERKVLQKYYPPDFDPSKLSRQKKAPGDKRKATTIRLMAPFSMQCTKCGEFIYKGRKFNGRKETSEENYLGLAIYLFYIRCTRCSSEIVFRTDPKHMDYVCVSGARRNFEPWRDYREEETDEQKLDRIEAEAAEEEMDKMEELETKVVDAKTEMAVADALDEIRARNARLEAAAKDSGTGAVMTAEERKQQEEEDFDRFAAEQWRNARAKLLTKQVIEKAEAEEAARRKEAEKLKQERKEREMRRQNRKRKTEEEQAGEPSKKIKAAWSSEEQVDSLSKDVDVTEKKGEAPINDKEPPRKEVSNKPATGLADLAAMYPSDSEEEEGGGGGNED